MASNKRYFLDAMEQGRANAAARRDRGLPTGKSAKGWNVKRPPLPDEFASHVIVARRQFAAECREIINDFLAECLRGRPFDAELDAIPF